MEDCKLKNENCKLQIGPGWCGVKVIIKMDEEEELRALPLLLRHSPGMVLPNRMHIMCEDALEMLRTKGIRYVLLSREAVTPGLEEGAGERV